LGPLWALGKKSNSPAFACYYGGYTKF